MSDEKEKIKQRIIVELENARLWGTFLLPGIGLALALLFSNQYLGDRANAKVITGAIIVLWNLFVIYMRNECLQNVRRYIEKL